MSKPKKKFKETKLGSFLSKTAPNILGTLGDVLPNQGVLGIVKNLIDKYDKNNLVPFGEFLPLEKFLKKIGFKAITNNFGSFRNGNDRNAGNIKTLECRYGKPKLDGTKRTSYCINFFLISLCSWMVCGL